MITEMWEIYVFRYRKKRYQQRILATKRVKCNRKQGSVSGRRKTKAFQRKEQIDRQT